ncbi:unnamed protein product [Penicillium salamii]|nr:unnamed protein product [Penicillium salamii]
MWKSMLTALALCTSSFASSPLADFALQKVLEDAAPIFGPYAHRSGNRSQWMKHYPDDTLLVHMNIPGTHDSATWNYTQASQDALKGITDLTQVTVPVPETFRCQQLSLINMLDMGIRAFDLRYAYDPTNTTLIFYHSKALLSEIATVDDVLFGFYQWLDDHPSETVFLSLQYESSTSAYASNDATLQLLLHNILTSPAARQYFIQNKDTLGKLGDARGKINLLRRFDLDKIPQSYTDALPGLHFSPRLWTDNGRDIELVYNAADNLTAYIEDYYQPLTPMGSDAKENIRWKYNATFVLDLCIRYKYPNEPPIWPRIMALGNGTEYTPVGGVNQFLVPFLRGQKGKRVGIVMFDFFDQSSELIDTFLEL